ncbi:uncharacterized mitochondrial protein-like protein [Tanacetum coccineum]|uniref:Uncharacterized mitochondrial protein-like protein n=1 Tax=Tanacetum coccineum TaxID=301880 RepID=A0ABQ5GMA5_9ASTR
MANLKFVDTHNMVAFLSKPEESDGFEQIFWSTVKAKTINGEVQLHALVDGKKIIITESTVRRDLQLEDAEELDEGSANPSDPHHTPTFIQPSPQPQKTQKLRKPKIKDTQVPQPCDPTENVAYEAVHKELGDSLVPRNHSNDSLLARGNTLRSDEDRLKLEELMELCTNLQNRVLDLEKTKTTQTNNIASLKRRVKKLEKKNRSRTHKLKRLYKVGLTARVESSRDQESLGEDASKQGRINAIDADDDITLVSVQDDADKEMFDVDALNGEEVFVAGQNENVVKEVVDAAQVSTAATTIIITTEEITLAQALKALKTSKPKVKGIFFQEPGKSTITTTISSQQSQDKGKGIMIEEPVKPTKKKDLIRLGEEVALKLQAEFDEEERLIREKAEKEQEANIALIETWDDIEAKINVDYQLAERLQVQEQEELSVEEKATLFQQILEKRRKHFAAKRAEEKINKPPTKDQQRKIMCTYLKNMEGYKLNDLKLKDFNSIQEMFDKAFKMTTKKKKVEDDKETTELKQCLVIIPDEEDVIINAIPLAVKSPSIVGWKIHKEGRKSYYQIIRADGKSQMYMIFSHMLKSFDREDLETLYKLIYMLVEKKYPLTPSTLTMMLEKKLMIDYESEMAYQLLKFIVKQLNKRIVEIKSLLDAVRMTAAQVYVNTTLMKSTDPGMVDPSAFKVDLLLAKSVDGLTKLIGFVPLVDALLLSNAKLILQLEILPPQKRARFLSSSSDFSAPPQVFEIRESSHKTHLEHYEEQIETILNHLDEFPLERIEHMEDKIEGLGRPIVRNTARMTYSHAVKGNWGSDVKTSTDHPLKNMEDRGILIVDAQAHDWNKDTWKILKNCKGDLLPLEYQRLTLLHKVLFTETECLVVSPDFKMPDENQILLKVPRQNNMYSFDMKTPGLTKDYACLIAKATSDESKLWHRRLGHINFKHLNKLVKGNLVRGLPSKVFRNDHTCVACQKGKQHKASCKAKLERTITVPLHTLHMDLFGPTSVKSINHASYCLVITDDCTRFSWVFFLATKDETSGILQNFIRQIENQLNHKVKIIRSDNGTEFKNRDMLEFCGNKGIKQEYSNARTPQQKWSLLIKNRDPD